MSCDDFYLCLSSSEAVGENAANFSINLPTPRTLQGSWKVGLKEIHYTHSPKQYVEPEPISFLVLGKAGCGDALAGLVQEAMADNQASHTPAFQSTLSEHHFSNFPHATILTYYKSGPEGGRPATYFMTPEGHYDSITKYIDDLNAVLNSMERHLHNLDKGEPIYFTYTDEGKVTCVWNYYSGYWRRLFALPILGEKSRDLLGMGNVLDKENMAFRSMIDHMIKLEDHAFLPYKHRLTHATDNILVVANVIEQTGGSRGEDSKILRVIENPGKFSALRPFNLYFNDTNYIKVPLRNIHNVHIRLISAFTHYDLTLAGTTTVVLHFIPQNNCVPLPTTKSSSIPVARNRSQPSALSLVGSEDPGEPEVTPTDGTDEPPISSIQASIGEPEVTPTGATDKNQPQISSIQATIATSLDLIEALKTTITD
jgi:hypothetical protein